MLKSCTRLILIYILISGQLLATEGEAILKLPHDHSLVIKEYLKIHKEYSKELCSVKKENRYYDLLREYRGNGYYLPEINEKIDIQTIKKFVPLMRLKKKWTAQNHKNLKSMKTWPYYKALANNLEESLELAQELKKRYFLEVSEAKKNEIRYESIKVIELIKKNYDLMLKQIPFLLSFQHPVDHLLNRKNYADLKDSKVEAEIRKANEIFFLRRILEDGAMDSDHTRPDKFLRSTIDTLALNIPKMTEFIEENIRYDLIYVLGGIKDQLSRGKEAHVKRFEAWEERETQSVIFYQKLIHNEDSKSLEDHKANDELMRKKIIANQQLKEFVFENLAQTYNFWRKQHKRNRALFVLDTILYNEVGVVDGEDGLERIDVAKVVRNRLQNPHYNFIPPTQDLYKYLKKYMTDDEINADPWLNVLFKEGEFSFTYFYISGVAKIFCQDMSARGQYLRRKNLWISMDILDRPMDSFDAVRYFSRASMNGRIDMSTVWADFQPIDECPGLIHPNQSRMKRVYLSDHYQYLYEFKHQGRKYQVLKIKDQTVVLTWDNKEPIFYKYRNPHFFKYFRSI